MKKYLAIAALAISLGGCQFFQNVETAFGVAVGAQVTPNQAYIAANAFNVVESTATTYLKLPLCSATQSKLCRTQAGSVAIYKAMLVGRQARNNLIAAVTSAGGPVSVSLYQALADQTSTLQQLVSSYNLGAGQ